MRLLPHISRDCYRLAHPLLRRPAAVLSMQMPPAHRSMILHLFFTYHITRWCMRDGAFRCYKLAAWALA